MFFMTSQKADRSFILLCGVLAVYVIVLAFGWLSQTPSQEELYSEAGRGYLEARKLFLDGNGIQWWTTDFLQGASSAQFLIAGGAMIVGNVMLALFGNPAGIKIMGLLALFFSGIGAYFFARKVTGNPWIGFLAGCLYSLNAQILLRIASFEHITTALALTMPPLILLSFLKMAEDGSWRSSFALAATCGFMMACYVKIGFLFLPVAAIYFVWLLVDQPSARVKLVRGAFVSFVILLFIALPLALPMAREFKWVAAFNFDNFAGWQQAFSIKSFLSVFDRGNGLLAGMRPDFVADRGQFYFGLVTLFALAVVLWWTRSNPQWLATRNGVLLRLFLGMTLVSLWLAHGPFSPFTGLQEFLKGSLKAPDWIAALVWLATFIPPILIYMILPATRRRGWWAALLIAVYLFVPGFVVLEKLQVYRDIRAPWGFWEVGFISIVMAGAIAIYQLFHSMVEKRDRLIIAGLLAVIAVLDASAYLSKFYAPGLPAQTFEDFHKAQRYLKTSLIDGRVYPMSGRYFYLLTPMESGRGLNSEAILSHFQMRGVRALLAGANTSPQAMQTYMNIAGISHILQDKQDPFTPQEVQNAFVQVYPAVFDSDYIRVLENKGSLAPAFVAREYIAMDPGTEMLAPAFLDVAGKINAVPLELTPQERLFPFLAGTGSMQQGIQVAEKYGKSPGAPFRRVSYALPRTNSGRMIFDPLGERKGWLVVTEAWHPDWRAFSDGEEVPIFKAFGGLMAVPLGKTEGPIEFIFAAPPWYSLAVWIAGLSWVGVLGLLVIMPLPIVPRRWRDWWTAAGRQMPAIQPPTSPINKAVVVIPTYNERDTINKALDLVLGLPRKVNVLVVDDGSPDGTADVVKGRPEFNKRIFLLEGKGKAGLGSAYRRGFQWAVQHGYEAAVEMDADLSHDPADVPKLLETLEKGAHLAVGSRYLDGISVLNWPQSRLFISTFGGFYVRTLTALPMSDPTSGFKAIRTEVLRDLDWSRVQAEGYAFQIELHHTAWKQGYAIKEVSIVFTERREGDSKMSTAISLEAAWRVLMLAGKS